MPARKLEGPYRGVRMGGAKERATDIVARSGQVSGDGGRVPLEPLGVEHKHVVQRLACSARVAHAACVDRVHACMAPRTGTPTGSTHGRHTHTHMLEQHTTSAAGRSER